MGMGGGAGRYSKRRERMVAVESLSLGGLKEQIWSKKEKKQD